MGKKTYFFLFFSIIILILSYLIYDSLELSFEEVELNGPNSKARCLDGSPYKFLVSKGFGDGQNSFLFFFEHGGFCGDNNYDPNNENNILPSCYKRLKRNIGSNRFPIIDRFFISYFSKLFSRKQSMNPNFYNWNKIFVKYCDGNIFQGYHEEPFIYNNTKIYVRGEKNVKEMLDYMIDNYSLTSASHVVVSGSSAGGIGSLMWSKYIHSLTPKSNFKVISDSGYFVDKNVSLWDTNIIREMMIRLTTQLKVEYTPLMSYYCPHKDEIWRCYFPPYFLDGIKNEFPILILTSLYDSWGLRRLVGTGCYFKNFKVNDNCNSTEIQHFERYAKYALEGLEVFNTSKIENKITAWVPKGYYHMYIYMNIHWNSPNYAVESYTLEKIIDDWYNERLNKTKKLYYDNEIKKYNYDVYWLYKYFSSLTKKLVK